MGHNSSPCCDDVFPLHLLDDCDLYRRHIVSYVLGFNDVLDAGLLRDSLLALLDTGDWRKLGGRLRLNEATHEIVVPRSPTDRLAFSHSSHDCAIREHPSARRLPPQTSAGSSVQPAEGDFLPFTGLPSAPMTLEKMMRQDRPLLTLHVTSFDDATVVGLSWPHILMDAMGLQALLRNWSLVLGAGHGCVSALADARHDVLEELDAQHHGGREPLKVEDERLGGLGIVFMLLCMLWYWACGSLERRTILLQESHLARLSKLAHDEIRPSDGPACFVSQGDVLAAWLARQVAASQRWPRPITICSYINARFRFPDLLSGRDCAQNMVQIAHIPLSSQRARGPLGEAALTHRRRAAEQSTKQQLLGYFRMQRESVKSRGKFRLFFGTRWSSPLLINNLTKVDFFREIDFSGAVLDQAQDSKRDNPPGTITYFYPLVLGRTAVLSSFGILGKDHAGNVCILGHAPRRTWDCIERELERL